MEILFSLIVKKKTHYKTLGCSNDEELSWLKRLFRGNL